jgi:8-oxo-dGTP diphosphatase
VSPKPSTGGTSVHRDTRIDALWRVIFAIGYRLMPIWWFVRRPSVEGAYVIVRRPRADGRWDVLLIRNSYKPGYSPPCGGLVRGEIPVEAALRELHEEVGLSLDPARLRPAGVVALELAHRHDRAHFFDVVLARDARPELRVDHREVVWAEFVSDEELPGLRLAPHFRVWLEQHAPWRDVTSKCSA